MHGVVTTGKSFDNLLDDTQALFSKSGGVNTGGKGTGDSDKFRNDDLPQRSDRGTPHTELRKDEDGKNIISGCEFDSQGNPVRDVDLSSRSGRNDHDFPHQHEYQLQPDGNWSRQDARPLNPDWPGTPRGGISK